MRPRADGERVRARHGVRPEAPERAGGERAVHDVHRGRADPQRAVGPGAALRCPLGRRRRRRRRAVQLDDPRRRRLALVGQEGRLAREPRAA